MSSSLVLIKKCEGLGKDLIDLWVQFKPLVRLCHVHAPDKLTGTYYVVLLRATPCGAQASIPYLAAVQKTAEKLEKQIFHLSTL